jgi:hypothetical protein
VLVPLEIEVRNASAAMAHMALILNTAKRDCQ